MKNKTTAEPEKDEFSELNTEDLLKLISDLNEQKEEVSNERIYLQLERDVIENIYQNTKSLNKSISNDILEEENKLELMTQEHNSEIRVYLQKIKQIEFENNRNLSEIEKNGKQIIKKELETNSLKIEEMKEEKNKILEKIKISKEDDVQKIKSKEQSISNILDTAKSEFLKELKKYENKNQHNYETLKTQLELKLKTELHEIEERKNYHINELIKNHEKAFEELKSFYSFITIENINLIKIQKNELEEYKKRNVVNNSKISEIKEKNKILEVQLKEY